MSKLRAAITAVGGFVPERVLSNKDLEKMVDTNDEWIKSRTANFVRSYKSS
jgi:3-oxoacyl-[acyl-carrier-protein] synthase-3